jgi:hypothetical protein
VSEPFPTPYEDLNAMLRELTAGVQAILGDNLIGFYLQGSFAAGDFDRHSDVDFIAAIARDLTDTEVQALNDLHARIFALDNPWAQHIEGSYFPQKLLRDPASCGRPLWFLDHGSRSLVRSNHCNTLVVRWVLREHGIALCGPEASTLIDPFTVDALCQEIAADMRDWSARIMAEPEHFNNHFYQTFIVLSYCRMLHSLETGRILSKRTGAEWAKAHLDPRWHGLIDRTWAGRVDSAASVRRPADPADFQATLDFIRYAIEQIPRFMPHAGERPPQA